MKTTAILAGLLVVATSAEGCEAKDDGADPSVVSRETCMKLCVSPLCDGVSEPGDDYGEVCVDQCMSKDADARAMGQDCADAYSRAVSCVSDLDCPPFLQWAEGDSTICSAELTAFPEQCPGMTFDFRE